MDPLGFGLENFNAIGAWRNDIAGSPIDSSGKLPTGENFNGPVELKNILLAEKNAFLRTVTEKMLSYSLGRGLREGDWITVQQIAKAVAQDGYKTQRLILEIVRSYPFNYRSPSEPKKTAALTP
jgi:hypothetical protein